MPPSSWSPDPSWPPPPAGWQLWVEDSASQPGHESSHRAAEEDPEDIRSPEEGQYFGDDRAWSDAPETAGAPSGLETPSAAESPSSPLQLIEIAPEDLAIDHLGLRAHVKWQDERRYEIGTILAVSADAIAINVKLSGIETPISFVRRTPQQPDDIPRIYLLR